mmetsp:Transcript_10351/g.26518  ORF Transcript_10351/g.26518 Transcript_10351/m.26518 type:complete len:84 (-) Transcript_10351:1076-1327(-)
MTNQMDAAAVELEAMFVTKLWESFTANCMKKCVAPTYHEEQLGKGEANCIDRCTNKFFEVYEIVGEKTKQQQQQAMDMQQMEA